MTQSAEDKRQWALLNLYERQQAVRDERRVRRGVKWTKFRKVFGRVYHPQQIVAARNQVYYVLFVLGMFGSIFGTIMGLVTWLV